MHWRVHTIALYLLPQDWWYHSVVISHWITTWDTVVLFALRHQYFRTGISTILMICSKYIINWTQWIWDHGEDWYRPRLFNTKSFCRTIKNKKRHGQVMSCSLARKKWLPECSTIQVWRAISEANTVARRQFRAMSGNRAYGVITSIFLNGGWLSNAFPRNEMLPWRWSLWQKPFVIVIKRMGNPWKGVVVNRDLSFLCPLTEPLVTLAVINKEFMRKCW